MHIVKNITLFAILVLGSSISNAQELNFTVNVNIQKLQTVDPSVFSTLENTLQEFVNNQKWTNDAFEQEERIEGNILLTVQEELSPTSFKASLAIQSSRPIYHSDAKTLMLNHIDNEVTFNYQQYDPLQYSKNTFTDNLSVVIAFYMYVIIGLDYDSFSPYGGEPYFQEAQDIVNNIPQGVLGEDAGWNSLKSDRNRFWIIENILSPRSRDFRQAIYDYHRQSIDVMADDLATGRAILIQALEGVGKTNQAYPNSMIVQMFVNAKKG